MGRRGVLLQDQQRWIFNRLAAAYRSRPPYPGQLVDALARLTPARGSIADLGAGIGHLALPLARRGLCVTAVEPAVAMLAELRRRAADQRLTVQTVQATAEESTLPSRSFHLVVLADALQWIDPELAGRETARILAPGGVVATIESQLCDTPFLRDLQDLMSRANPRARRSRSTASNPFHPQVGRGAPETVRFADESLLDAAQLSSVIRSLSFAGPALAPSKLREVLDGASQLALKHGGAVWRRELILTWSRVGRG